MRGVVWGLGGVRGRGNVGKWPGLSGGGNGLHGLPWGGAPPEQTLWQLLGSPG